MADNQNVIKLRRRPFHRRLISIYGGYRKMHFGRWRAFTIAWHMARI